MSLTTSSGDMKEASPQETQGHGSQVREAQGWQAQDRLHSCQEKGIPLVQMTALMAQNSVHGFGNRGKPSTKSVVLKILVEKLISGLCHPKDMLKKRQLLPTVLQNSELNLSKQGS